MDYRLHSTAKVFIHLWLSIAVDELLAQERTLYRTGVATPI